MSDTNGDAKAIEGMAATCSRCGHPRPESVNHIWACCGDGPGYGNHIKPETLACRERELEAVRLELERAKDALENAREAADGHWQAAMSEIQDKLTTERARAEEAERRLDDVDNLRDWINASLESAFGRERLSEPTIRDVVHALLNAALAANARAGRLEEALRLSVEYALETGQLAMLLRMRSKTPGHADHVPLDGSEKEQGKVPVNPTRPEMLCVPHGKPSCHECWLSAYLWRPTQRAGASNISTMEQASDRPVSPDEGAALSVAPQASTEQVEKSKVGRNSWTLGTYAGCGGTNVALFDGPYCCKSCRRQHEENSPIPPVAQASARPWDQPRTTSAELAGGDPFGKPGTVEQLVTLSELVAALRDVARRSSAASLTRLADRLEGGK